MAASVSIGRPPHSVPTLTEVVDWPPPEAAQPTVDEVPSDSPPATRSPLEAAAFDAVEVEQRVLADVQHQVELMLEVRLREALTPLLSRTADTLVRDTRRELAATLREIVGRAVAQELARRRGS
jgi:hypothetical protein